MLEFAQRKRLALRVILGVSMKYAAHFAFLCAVLTTNLGLAQELLARWQFEDTTVSKCLDESSSKLHGKYLDGVLQRLSLIHI